MAENRTCLRFHASALVTCKFEEDPIKTEGAIMSTFFSGAQGQVTPKSSDGCGTSEPQRLSHKWSAGPACTQFNWSFQYFCWFKLSPVCIKHKNQLVWRTSYNRNQLVLPKNHWSRTNGLVVNKTPDVAGILTRPRFYGCPGYLQV